MSTSFVFEALFPSAYVIKKVADQVLSTTDGVGSKDKSIEQLSLEARKQEIEMAMARGKAVVAQELAIAKRIELAEEVEIEEFYELAGDGSAGLKADSAAVSLGLSASGKRVTKRIYKFRGFADESQSNADAQVGEAS